MHRIAMVVVLAAWIAGPGCGDDLPPADGGATDSIVDATGGSGDAADGAGADAGGDSSSGCSGLNAADCVAHDGCSPIYEEDPLMGTQGPYMGCECTAPPCQ